MEQNTIFNISQILPDVWINSNSNLETSYLNQISEDMYLSNSLKLHTINENIFNFDINFIEQSLKKMNFSVDPSILEVTRLLTELTCWLSTVSYYFLYFAAWVNKFEEAEKYIMSLVYLKDKNSIEKQIDTYYRQMKHEKESIWNTIKNDDKLNEVRKTFLKQSLTDIDSKFNTLIDLEKKRLEPKFLSIVANSNSFLLELKRKKRILEFCKDYFQFRQDNFKESINTLKKHITVYEIWMKNSSM